jgi:hypothetical protein
VAGRSRRAGKRPSQAGPEASARFLFARSAPGEIKAHREAARQAHLGRSIGEAVRIRLALERTFPGMMPPRKPQRVAPEPSLQDVLRLG